MNSGIEKRLKTIFHVEDGRSLCIACDHGLMMDPSKSWLNISTVVRGSIDEKADGLLLSFGQTRRFATMYGRRILPSCIIRTDWTNLLRLRDESTQSGIFLQRNQFEFRRLINAKEVLFRYGGTAAIGFLFVDPEEKNKAVTIKASQELIEECHEIGLPCIIEVLPLLIGYENANPADLLREGVKIALELGADVIKMPVTEEIGYLVTHIHQAGKRALVLGGSNLADESLFVDLMRQAMAAGVDGLLVGRNVSQSKDPARLIQELRGIVHSI